MPRLRRVLERLVRTGIPPVAAPVEGFEALVEMIASEVDETVLPRKLALFDGDTECAVLTVSNRRLVALEMAAAHPNGAQPDPACADEAARLFVERLSALADSAGPFRLGLKGRVEGFSVNEVSCSARNLLNAISGAGQTPRIETFLAGLRLNLVAWALGREGAAELETGGDDGEANRLLTLAEAHRRRTGRPGAAQVRAARHPNCTILPYPEGRRVLLATDRDTLALGIFDEMALNAVTEAWAATFRA